MYRQALLAVQSAAAGETSYTKMFYRLSRNSETESDIPDLLRTQTACKYFKWNTYIRVLVKAEFPISFSGYFWEESALDTSSVMLPTVI